MTSGWRSQDRIKHTNHNLLHKLYSQPKQQSLKYIQKKPKNDKVNIETLTNKCIATTKSTQKKKWNRKRHEV